MIEFNVYEVEPGRFAYRVESVLQEWHPESEGFVAMSEEEARFKGGIVAARLSGS